MQARRPRLITTNTPVRYFGRGCGAVAWAPEIQEQIPVPAPTYGVFRRRRHVFYWSDLGAPSVKGHGSLLIHTAKFAHERIGKFGPNALQLYTALPGYRFAPTFNGEKDNSANRRKGVVLWTARFKVIVIPPPPPEPPAIITSIDFTDIPVPEPTEAWEEVP